MNATVVDKVISAMQAGNGLPAFEQNVSSIIASLAGGKSDRPALVATIIEDVSLTQKVLKLANSPMYAPFAESTASVSSALDILGTDGLMHIALGANMVDEQSLPGNDPLVRTQLAAEVARKACPDRLEDAAVAGLMYDLGRLVTERFLPDEAMEIDRRAAAGSEDAAVAVLGMTLQDLGAEVARRWNLPGSIVGIIDGSGDDQLVNVARLSTEVATLVQAGKVEEAATLVASRPLPGVDTSQLAGFVKKKGGEFARRKPLPASAHAAKKRTATQALNELCSALAARKFDSVETLGDTLYPSLQKLLDISHGLFFTKDKTGAFLIRHGAGKHFAELRKGLQVSAETKPTAFHAAIQNNADISITDISKLKPGALPDGYARLLPGIRRFVVLPVARTQVSGLLYFDWEVPRILEADELAAVRRLRDLFLPFVA